MPAVRPSEVSSLAKYLKYLLAPIIRYCLRHAIKLHDLIELSKALYVEEAKKELAREGRRLTTSKLSLMTGVHRRDVMRLQVGEYAPKKPTDIITRVIGQWWNDPRFRTKSGQPRVLGFESGQGEFADLVAAVSREIKAYSILNELERAQIVTRTPRGIRLEARMYIPSGDTAKGFQFLEQDCDDLVAAVEENLTQEPAVPNLHIKTQYDNIPIRKVAQIKDWLLLQGSAFHEKARNYLSQFDRDINSAVDDGGGKVRVAVGSFSVVEKIDAVDSATEDSENETD